MPKKAGVPSHTQSPNVFYDEWIKEINSLAELKVVEVVIRGTFGWHADRIKMSLTDIMDATGLSKSSTQEGVKRAIKDGYIARVGYKDSFAYEIPIAVPESGTPLPEVGIPELSTREYRKAVQEPDQSIDVLKKERNGHAKQDKPLKPETNVEPVPFHGQEFLIVFGEFEVYCRQRRKAVTGMARTKLFRKLAKYPEAVVVEALNESMANRWTGVFPEKIHPASRNGNNGNGERPVWMASGK